MANIRITKNKDGYSYEYDYINWNKKIIHVTKSGFSSLESALKAARKSCDEHIKKNKNPIEGLGIKLEQEKNKAVYKIKNMDMTEAAYKLAIIAVYSSVALTLICGGVKVYTDLKSKFPEKDDTSLVQTNDFKELITADKCDFSNLHIILRTADSTTIETGAVTSDMLNRLGVSNEIISGDSDLTSKVNAVISNNPNSNIVIINLQSGKESKDRATVMGDFSNISKYQSDILASCIKASLDEYGLKPLMRSGSKGDYWRTQTEVEKELTNSSLNNSVCQLSIDLPTTISEDELTRNDSAASIVEGIMRWTTLDVTERYKNIYYTAQYGDTLTSLIEDFGISLDYIEKYSSVNMNKGVIVGDCILVGVIPHIATDEVTAVNKFTTMDKSLIEEKVITYTVQSGDTATKIANMYGVRVEDLVVPSGNINNIYVGDTIYITTYTLYETHGKNIPREEGQKHV